MKLNLNKPLRDLDGKPIPDQNVGQMLAVVLASSTEGDPIKFMEWALAMHRGKTIEIDLSDSEMLRRFVETNRTITNLAKSAILTAIVKARDARA